MADGRGRLHQLAVEALPVTLLYKVDDTDLSLGWGSFNYLSLGLG